MNDKKGLTNMYIATKRAICSARESGAPNLIGDSYWSYCNLRGKRCTGEKRHPYAERFLSSCRVYDIAKQCNKSGKDVSQEVAEICGVKW